MKRVISYIDGFNMYYGLKSKGWDRYLWLDVEALSRNLLRPDQTLVHTKYFTARLSSPAEKVKRQNTYIEAMQTLTDTSLYFGKYMTNPHTCRNCGYVHMAPSEKMTDVNIAVELLQDAFQDAFDTAFSFQPTATSSRHLLPSSGSFRRNVSLWRVHLIASLLTSLKMQVVTFKSIRIPITKSQFPEEVRTASGFILCRPQSWK